MASSKEKTNYASQKRLREKAEKLYPIIAGAFKDKSDQSSAIDRYWDIYNTKLSERQVYDGDSEVFVPIVRDAIEAQVKRYTSLLMPVVGRTVDVISETGDIPFNTIAIIEHYIRQCRFRTLLPGIFRNGAVEGQWSMIVGWKRDVRKVTRKVTRADEDDPSVEVEDIEDTEIVTAGPTVSLIPVQDLAVVPPTAPSIEDAEMVIDILRYSEEKVDEMVEEGTFLREAVYKMTKGAGDVKDPGKERASEAGVKMKGSSKYYLIYRCWMKFKVETDKEPCILYFGGANNCLGIEKNPYWSGKIPILSEPLNLIPGSFWGKSDIAPVEHMQYQCNDAINMGMDSAMYALLPIIMTDPVKNPKIGSMILAAAAIWETNPNDTQFANFPPLWKDALTLVAATKAQVMESMGVNDALMGKAPAGRKNAQAIAQAEAAAMASVSDPVRRFESGIMDKLLEWFFELDQQFREDDLVIRSVGDVGLGAKIERIPPQSFDARYFFKWNGIDHAMGAQRVQQMISYMNVLRGIPPQQMGGRTLDLGPIIEYSAEVMFGPNLAPHVLKDNRNKMSFPPELENEVLVNDMDLGVSPMDDDMEHVRVHHEAAQATGDPEGHFRHHIMLHMAQAQAKTQAALPAPAKGQPGQPGLGGPGVAGTPRPGSVPAGPRGTVQAPAGAVHPDMIQDPNAMPRG